MGWDQAVCDARFFGQDMDKTRQARKDCVHRERLARKDQADRAQLYAKDQADRAALYAKDRADRARYRRALSSQPNTIVMAGLYNEARP